jgi:general secretion pathway protein K
MSRRPARAGGVALIIVLWIVAALGVLVLGLVQAQRSELRLAGAARDQLLGAAVGQAAIQLAVQRQLSAGATGDRLLRLPVSHAGLGVDVEVMPLSGLIDLNRAPEPLLVDLFVQAGALDEGAARALAAAVLARRQHRLPDGRDDRLEAAEELLALPGAGYDLLARIAPLVTTDSAGSGRVHPLAAPYGVLLVLARGRADIARRIADERDAGAATIDTTRLEGAHIDATVSSRYRFTAHVPMADGAWVVVERDIDLRPFRHDAAGQPPWQVLRARQWRAAGPAATVTARHVGG